MGRVGEGEMIDRKKVIETLWDWHYRVPGCTDEYDALMDAIALLKEQEAVEPSFKQDEKGIFVWCCGSCGAYMYHIYDGIDKAKEYVKFCRQCGRSVKW